MFNFLSRGDLTITPEKYQYTPGETIKGSVSLKLKKPTPANRITVLFRGEITHVSYDSKGDVRESTKPIFDFLLPLDGPKEYAEAEYPFEIKIPMELGQQQKNPLDPESTLGKVLQVASTLNTLAGRSNSRTEWYLEAQLDISGAIDMRKRVQINLA